MTELTQVAATVLRYIKDWEDAEERYHAPRESDGRPWASLPNSIGAKFIMGQIASAQDGLRGCRDELDAAVSAGGADPLSERDENIICGIIVGSFLDNKEKTRLCDLVRALSRPAPRAGKEPK